MLQNPFYVYSLKDPREKPAKPFYIGKGTGNRAWEHIISSDNTEKGLVIKAIQDSGFKVLHTIIADNLTEEQALKIEAELISAFGIRNRGGLLTNKIQKKTTINVLEGCYEKAQMGLKFLKLSIMEFIKANPSGIKNSDVAKYLGLQADYDGGSKDYLSYSILGLLKKEGRIERIDKKKHIAKIE